MLGGTPEIPQSKPPAWKQGHLQQGIYNLEMEETSWQQINVDLQLYHK